MRVFVSIPMKYLLCLGMAIVVIFLLAFFTAQGIMQMNQLKADRDRIKAVIGQLREDNRKLSKQIESLNTLDGIEERARDLGLVAKDEILYIF
jgi:cell division protein FtsB